MSNSNEKSTQETATTKKEPSTSNKPPSYGTRHVQNNEDIEVNVVTRGATKK
jgi:hypothetical protein